MTPSRVVLITGTRKGIGRFLAERYAEAGFAVVGCSRTRPEWSLAGYEHVDADVANEDQVRALFDHVRTRHGRLDVLVNNAGIASMNHALLTPLAVVERVMRTNFFGTFTLCREAAKMMMRQRHGRIVNFSTVAVPMHLEGEAAYAASKAAVEMFTRTFAHEVGVYGITVNAVAPSPLETDLIRNVPRSKIDALVSRLAIKRLAEFEDIGHVVDFFVSEKASYVTGQVVYLGGP